LKEARKTAGLFCSQHLPNNAHENTRNNGDTFQLFVPMKGIVTLLLIFGFALPQGSAQNLVNNGSFETKSYCPSNFNQQSLNTIAGWWQATDGTPDYFHTCSDKVGVPNNVFGQQLAKDGDGYTGLVTFSVGKRNYREYLQTKLTRPLAAGEMVCIEMYVSAADYCNYVTDGIGILLSEKKAESNLQTELAFTGTMSNPRLNMLDESNAWQLLSDVYVAKGGEEYLTIGNFKADKELKVIRRTEDMSDKGYGTWSYMYIDDIKVRPVQRKLECSCENEYLASIAVDPPLELSEYKKIKLDAILFDFDADLLTDAALNQLEEVYVLLKKNRSMYMEISGHTDVVGPDGYNLGLSKRRAQRVIDHLVMKGIDASRLQLTFFGKLQPVANNETDDGRHQNRRVEFQILEKKFELIQ
jgi:outer membrane protein OmpA-like peptidoglycan-associated protein